MELSEKAGVAAAYNLPICLLADQVLGRCRSFQRGRIARAFWPSADNRVGLTHPYFGSRVSPPSSARPHNHAPQDRQSTPPIPRGCLLTPCGIKTSPHTFPHAHLHAQLHSDSYSTARVRPHAFLRAHLHANSHSHLHSTGTCTHLRPRADSLTLPPSLLLPPPPRVPPPPSSSLTSLV